jgi:hypothetical protein
MLHKARPHKIVKAAPKAGLNDLCWVTAFSFTCWEMCLREGIRKKVTKTAFFGADFVAFSALQDWLEA